MCTRKPLWRDSQEELYDWRLEEQAASKQAATCRCSSPPSTARRLLWSPVARQPPPMYAAAAAVPEHYQSLLLPDAECSQLIRCNVRTPFGVFRTRATDWSDSWEETVCDCWPAGPVEASLDLRISIKTRPDWADTGSGIVLGLHRLLRHIMCLVGLFVLLLIPHFQIIYQSYGWKTVVVCKSFGIIDV